MAFSPVLGHRDMEKAGMEFLQQTGWQTPKAESLVGIVSEGTEQRLLQLCRNLQHQFFLPSN